MELAIVRKSAPPPFASLSDGYHVVCRRSQFYPHRNGYGFFDCLHLTVAGFRVVAHLKAHLILPRGHWARNIDFKHDHLARLLDNFSISGRVFRVRVGHHACHDGTVALIGLVQLTVQPILKGHGGIQFDIHHANTLLAGLDEFHATCPGVLAPFSRWRKTLWDYAAGPCSPGPVGSLTVPAGGGRGEYQWISEFDARKVDFKVCHTGLLLSIPHL